MTYRPRGAVIKTIGEVTIKVELPLPRLLLDAAGGSKGKTTEGVEVKVVVAKDEAKRDRRVGAGDAEGGAGAGGGASGGP